jgi:hypothetical protein
MGTSCCWWCIESGRGPRRNCSIGACSVKTSHTRDMPGLNTDAEPQCTSPPLVRHEEREKKPILLQLFSITRLALRDYC